MEETNCVRLPFNVETGVYIQFIEDLSKQLAKHTDCNTEGKRGDHPLLPKQEAAKPKRWMCIELSVKDKYSTEEIMNTATLAVRGDNVYLSGFKNQRDKWYEFGKMAPTKGKKSSTRGKKSPTKTNEDQWKLTQLIPGSTSLGFTGRHEELLRPSRWTCKEAKLGKFSARDAVVELSNYNGEGRKKDSIKPYLFKLIVMISESARMFPYRNKVWSGWGLDAGVNLKDDDNNLTEYLHNWEHMSQAMMGWAPYTITKLRNMGIEGHEQACKVVHLILNSPTCEKFPPFYESAGGDEPGNEGDGNDNSPQSRDGDDNGQSPPGGSDDQSSRQRDGNDQSSRQGGVDGQWSRQEHSNGHPPQPTDGTEYVHHGQSLVEVFTLGPANSDIPFLRSITVFDGRLGQIIFWNEGGADREGNFVLDGPYRGISADGRVALKIIPYTEEDGEDEGEEVLIWDSYKEDEQKYDQILTKDIPGDLKLTYAVLSNAVEASVQVDVFLFENIAVHGEIIVKSQLARGEKATIVLVRYEVDDQVELVASSAGSRIPLARSVVAWPVCSPIEIIVECCFQPVTTSTDEGTSSIASATTPLTFAFNHHAAKVRFHTLEGIGYVRVSVDDTREYRDEPNNSLPISLTNQENPVVKIGSLDVHPSQLTFTFHPHKTMSCLLHLTNNSYDSNIAFRRRPSDGILLKLSGILPPDSRSTYLVRPESQLPPNLDAFSFILESCVVPEEQEDEEDVDKIFAKQTKDGIVEVTLPATVCGSADEIIPSASQGSHHSIDVRVEEPSMAKELTYGVVRSGVELATVQVDLFLYKKTDFYGKITAHSQLPNGEEVSVLFSCEFKDRVDVRPSSTGWNVPFTRPVVAWPLGSPLLIKVACSHTVPVWHDDLHFRVKWCHLFCSTTDKSTIYEGTSASTATIPIFEGTAFSFDDNTDKVRFASLEGFGYIRVSVDDTGKYREIKPNNSLPRSLMNKIEPYMPQAFGQKKIDPDMCKETKLLVIRPSHLTHCLLHLTNKSDDQHVAFRLRRRTWEALWPRLRSWETSGILPPSSTSTYMLGLNSQGQLTSYLGRPSLTLQSCAASQDQKDVDTIFLNTAEKQIEEVPLSSDGCTWRYERTNLDPWSPGKGMEVALMATVSDPMDVSMTSETQIKAPTSTDSSIEQNDLLDVYPLQLRFFPFKLNKVMCCPLRLTNRTDDYVLFRFRPYTPDSNLIKLYYEASLPPRSTCTYVLLTKKLKCEPNSMDELSVILQSCAAEKITRAGEYNSSQDPTQHGAIPKAICNRQPIPPKIEVILTEHDDSVCSVDVHPTEPRILAGNGYGDVSIWNYQTQEKESKLTVACGDYQWIYSVIFITREKWFVAGDRNGYIHVVNITMSLVKKFQAHEMCVESLAVHPNQTFVLSASRDMLIKLWNWDMNPDAEWECVQTYGGHTGYVKNVMFNPYDHGHTFASASDDGKVKIWSTSDRNNSPTPIAILDCGQDKQQRVAYFSSGGQQYIFTGSNMGAARVWDLRTNICIKELEGYCGGVVGVVDNINPLLITISVDNVISFLDAITYESRYSKVDFHLGKALAFAYVEVEGKRSLVIALSYGIAIMEMSEDHVNPPATAEQDQKGVDSA